MEGDKIISLASDLPRSFLALLTLLILLFPLSRAGAVPRIKEIHVEKIGALTGPTSPNGELSADVCGTDLGTMTEIGHKIFFAFGDTFGYVNGHPMRMSGVDWRSNVFASAPAENVGEVPRLTWRTGPTGKAIPIIEGAHMPAFTGSDGEQTKIPTAMARLATEFISITCPSTALPRKMASGIVTIRNSFTHPKLPADV